MPEMAFVSDFALNRVYALDARTLLVQASIPVGTGPGPLDITPDGKKVYVANQLDGTVSVIDVTTLGERARIRLSPAPGFFSVFGVRVRPQGDRVYVSAAGTGAIAVIDRATDAVIAQIPVPPGLGPLGLDLSPDGERGFVALTSAMAAAGEVGVFDAVANELLATVPVGDAPAAVTVLPDGRKVYVTLFFAGEVVVLDPLRIAVAGRIAVGDNPWWSAATPDGRLLFVTQTVQGAVTVIDTQTDTVAGTVPTPTPVGADLTSDGRRVIVAANAGGRLPVFRTRPFELDVSVPLGVDPAYVKVRRAALLPSRSPTARAVVPRADGVPGEHAGVQSSAETGSQGVLPEPVSIR